MNNLDLEKEFPKQIYLLKEISHKFKNAQYCVKELNEIVIDLKNTNITLQQTETKLNEKINNFNNELNKEAKTINECYKIQKENNTLKKEKETLQTLVNNLEQKIIDIEIYNKKNIENIINQFTEKEKSLQDHIETLQASYTLDNFEKEIDIKKLKSDYEEKLQNSEKREQNLKIEIFDLRHQMIATVSVLNKKISELQEKNKRPETDKPSIASASKNTNFMSAKNVLKISTSNSLQNNSNNSEFNRNSINNKTFTDQSSNSTHIQNTVNISSIEINPVKKFQFRKPSNSGKKLLSETFDPFKMHSKESCFKKNSGSQSDSENSCNIIDNSFELNMNEKKYNKSKSNITKNTQPAYDNVESCVNIKIDNNSAQSVPKKRKLFDPNNFDYLE